LSLIGPPSMLLVPSHALSFLLAVQASGWILLTRSSQTLYSVLVSFLSAQVLEMASDGIRQRLPQLRVVAAVYQREARDRRRQKLSRSCLEGLAPDTARSKLSVEQLAQ
jgi:hypothetical protein